MNYKPIYESPMNYLYQENSSVTRFASAKFAGISVNASSVNETDWQGSFNIDVSLMRSAYGYAGTGKQIDWNLDGQIQPSGAANNVVANIVPPTAGGAFRFSILGEF